MRRHPRALIRRLRPIEAFAGAIGAVVVVTSAAALVSPPDLAEPATREVPVASATLVCPAPVTTPPDTTSSVAALAPEDVVPDADASGEGTIGRIGAADDAVTPLAAPGTVTRWPAPGDGQAVPGVVLAEGSLAPAMAAEQSTRVAQGQLRGRSGVACAAAGTDFWFVGGSTDIGRVTTVSLTNTGGDPAIVDIFVWGDVGEELAPGGRGITVLPGSQEQVLVDALAPGLPSVALRVTTRTGSVSAAVSDAAVSGLDPLGSDWVPVSAPPSSEVVVPGLAPAPDGTRILSLLAPGDDPSVVQLRLIAPDGTFAPTDLDVVELAPGELTSVDLSTVSPDVWSSVWLESDVPVIAGLRQLRGAAGELPDVAYLAGALPVTGPTSVLDGVRDPTTETVLVLAAPLGAVSGSLIVTPDGGEPVSTPFTVAGGTTSAVPLAPEAASFTAVVVPDEGSDQLFAARWITEREALGPMITAQPLTTPPISVLERSSRQDLRTGLTAD